MVDSKRELAQRGTRLSSYTEEEAKGSFTKSALQTPIAMTSVTLPGMGKRLLSDQLWEAIEPMLP